MKEIIAKVYYDKAKKLYPNEKNKHRLILIAEMIKMNTNSLYGKYGSNMVV